MTETVRQARQQYFEKSGFNEETYSDRWVRLPIGPCAIYLPNPSSRKRCIPRHDIHHIVTGYGTDWVGEFEIAAWELGAGCGRYWFAWMANFQAVMLGALFHWGRIVKAFAWGRRESSLYIDLAIDDTFLDQPIVTLQARLRTDAETYPVRWSDRLLLGTPILFAWGLFLGLLIAVGGWLLGFF